MENRRKNIRLPREIYGNQSQVFSITICTQDRRPLFENERWAEVVSGSLGEHGDSRGSVPVTQTTTAEDGVPTKNEIDGIQKGGIPAVPVGGRGRPPYAMCGDKARRVGGRADQSEVPANRDLRSIKAQTDLYAWCVMPDHLHLLLSPRQGNLIDILNSWKSYTSHLLQKEFRRFGRLADQSCGRGRPPYEMGGDEACRVGDPADRISGRGRPPYGVDAPGIRRGSVPAAQIWQRGFYDHALRKEEDLQKVAAYIVNNPVRSGLVKNWLDYRFSRHRWM